MAKKKKEIKEVIPEGMKREDYADAAFRKKVSIIMGCILLVGVLAVSGVLINGWYKTDKHNKEFEKNAAIFTEEKNVILDKLSKIEKHEDKAKVKIEVTDDNFHDWIGVLDASYQLDSKDDNYAAFGGATIHLQGKFITKEYGDGKYTQYWVYRKHDHGDGHNHEHSDAEDAGMIPIEVIFEEGTKIPKDGTWVDVVGIVGPDSTKNLSGIRNAKITIMEKPGNEFVK